MEFTNGENKVFVAERTLISIFAEAVQSNPTGIAVRDHSHHLSYRQLDEVTNRFAGRLVSLGVTPGDRVGIALNRTTELAVALIGVLKSGAVAVCIDLRYPKARRAFMLHDSGARLVITEPELGSSFEGSGSTAIFVGPTDQDPVLPEIDVSPDSAATVLFTSGSSGTPKGVVLEHRNVAFFATNPAMPKLHSSDRTGQVSSVSFDAFHFEFWSCLAAGGEVVFLDTLPDALEQGLGAAISHYGITAMLVPTMVFDHVVRESAESFSALRVLCVGGDVLSPSACELFFSAGFDGELFNLYGPTETTTACTVYPVSLADVQASAIPLGRPLAGVQIQLVDDALQQVPEGEEGELLISGPGVAREYLGQSDLTAAAFTTVLTDDGARVRAYRSGDRGRRRASGVLEFAGRRDHQVKIRGYRVELGEVAAAIAQLPGVDDVVVLPWGEGQERQLSAFVVAAADSISIIQQACQDTFPDYMVPARIIVLNQLPRTAHGKRDKAALIELLNAPAQHRDERAADNESERYLIGLWQELLGVDSAGPDDDFYALGGHSMLAFRLHRRIAAERGVDIPLADLMAIPTLGMQAKMIQAAEASAL